MRVFPRAANAARAALLAASLVPLAPPWPAAPGQQLPEPSTLSEPASLAPTQSELDALAALERGLAFLAQQQDAQPDGSLPRVKGRRHVPVPSTAIAALAFMAAGSHPDRGPYGEHVSRAIDYLTQRADLTPGSRTHGYIASEGDVLSRMHGHGFATLALTQAYAMSPRSTRGQRVSEVLVAAVALIERTQGLEGGWFYQPTPSVDHENSVTVGLVQALRAARDAGFDVDLEVIARAVDYVRRCQKEDGSFRYGLEQDQSSLALTAAGISTLNFLGEYEGPEVALGMDRLWQQVELRRDAPGGQPRSFPYYERLYLALALWQHPDLRLFENWLSDETERVLDRQNEDGSWDDEDHGSCYATAMNCLFLALPLRLLPTFQR